MSKDFQIDRAAIPKGIVMPAAPPLRLTDVDPALKEIESCRHWISIASLANSWISIRTGKTRRRARIGIDYGRSRTSAWRTRTRTSGGAFCNCARMRYPLSCWERSGQPGANPGPRSKKHRRFRRFFLEWVFRCYLVCTSFFICRASGVERAGWPYPLPLH
jgi:hypothetical protein